MKKKRELIIAIDGPSGAGKSTLSKLLSRRLGYVNIDTGAMYRCVALAALRKGIAPADAAKLEHLCRDLEIGFVSDGEENRVILEGEDVSEAIRTPEVSLLTSRISAVPEVREALVALQRRMGENGGVVLEGRDIGTVVFPHADVKFFLVASARERGRRRYLELKEKGLDVDLEQTITEVEERDRADSEREHAPLVQAEDALPVDSTEMTIDEVLDYMVEVVSRCRDESGSAGGKERR
ncbi:MAG: (d)CMP kinase [Desulfuromonadales bacterium]|nr:(d)CMP kinase [Desulfuromonadales bacterium]NIR34171.1 (d)CMP kinase [Desulfuromonadales bacterium]NIS40315.1 (d)CMP kinase [Desulfuromonadales bacterium]